MILTLLPTAVSMAQGGVSFRVIKGIGEFSRITVAPNINVTLVMADEVHLLPKDVARRILPPKSSKATVARVCVVRGEPTVCKAVDCVAEGGSLTVSANKFKFRRSRRIDVFVVCDTALTQIRGATGGNITTRGCLRLSDVLIRADDAQQISISARAASVSIVASTRSSVRLSGSTRSIDASLTSASSLDASAMTCQQLNISATDESRATATANTSATITAKNKSTVTIRTSAGARVTVDKETGCFVNEEQTAVTQ